MTLVIGTIPSTGQTVEIEIPTARIPELPVLGDPIEGDDEVAVYDSSENSTRQQKLSILRDYFITGGGGGGVTPVLQGDDLEIIADSANMSGLDLGTGLYNRVLVTTLENKQFTLARVGYGQLLTRQFLILPSGGFELVGDTVRPGDVYFAHIYTPTVGGGGGTSTASSVVNGIALIADDTVLSTPLQNKLLHVSSPTRNVAITLYDIATTPDNLIVPIETTISNGYMTKVQTQGGQLIYVGESAVTEIWLGSNEFVWLLRGVDGWYVMKISESVFEAGQPFFDVKQRLNSVVAKGQIANRVDYPRIMAMLAEHPELMVTEIEWTGTYRSRYSDGDGVDTFRFPDYQNLSFRALANIDGSDTERVPNLAGVTQNGQVGEFTQTIPTRVNFGSGLPYGLTDGSSGSTTTFTFNAGKENRSINAGLLPLIKT